MSRFILPFADVGSGVKPSSGAKLFFFASNTSTPKKTYSNNSLDIGTANTNPVIANGNGVFGDIWLETGKYRVVLQDRNGVQQWDADPIISDQPVIQFSGLSSAVALVSANPENYPENSEISTISYRTKPECDSLAVPYPDKGGADYTIVPRSQHDQIRNYANVNGTCDKLLSNGNVLLFSLKSFVDPFNFGAVANDNGLDAGFNSYTALQSSLDFAVTQRVSWKLGAGFYLTDSTLTVNLESITTESDRRPNILGSGRGNTQIRYSGGETALRFIGGVVGGAGVHSYIEIADFSLFGKALPTTSKGLQLDDMAFMSVGNVRIRGFDLGVEASDVLSSQFDRMSIRFNNKGMNFFHVDFSRPNAISLTDCVIASNASWGVQVTGGSLFNIRGGSIEGNGAINTGFGIKAVNSGVEGAVGLNINGTYFEHNQGVADVFVVSTTGKAIHNVRNCTFNRISSSKFVFFNVHLETQTESSVTVGGCGFKEFNTYTPNILYPYLSATGSLVTRWNMIDDGTNFYNDLSTAPTRSYNIQVTPNKNLFRNPEFISFQKGNGPFTGTGVNCDGWINYLGGSDSVQKQSLGGDSYIEFSHTSGATFDFGQRMEIFNNVDKFSLRRVTLTGVYFGTAFPDNQSLTYIVYLKHASGTLAILNASYSINGGFASTTFTIPDLTGYTFDINSYIEVRPFSAAGAPTGIGGLSFAKLEYGGRYTGRDDIDISEYMSEIKRFTRVSDVNSRINEYKFEMAKTPTVAALGSDFLYSSEY